jgi:prolipoprotein diacylglyceryltransferase
MMAKWLDPQLILALAIVIAASVGFGYLVYRKIRSIGLLRDDFDRRAPWIALGVILGGVVLYYVKVKR